ncbi:hydroxypyruvate isomerase [Lampropedia puyangensis]|uniref:Hydroxypyruvate isomerase n=1 Tax=Lampropedia puyangensis TaxID=1330072 RepID=A0A4S8F5W5_9BURK|nr:TIM barrel protein [Lampropedia puyangensis]THU01544.1 hydroxypyruvate isomerase [Lampropedia puyangensis]
MSRFAANLGFLYAHKPFEARFAAAAEDGFKGVEYASPYEWPAHVLAQHLQEAGLQQVLINTPAGGADAAGVRQAWAQGLRGTACLVGQEKAFRYGVELALEYAQALACPRIHVMAGVATAADAGDRRTWLHRLAWAAEKAASNSQHPVTLLLEAINHVDMPGYWLHTQAQAFAALQEIGHPHLAMQMDFYHCQMTEGDALAQWQRYAPSRLVQHIQIAGAPGRHEPDVGQLPWQELLVALDEAAYPGWVGLEYHPQTTTTAGLGWLKQLHL